MAHLTVEGFDIYWHVLAIRLPGFRMYLDYDHTEAAVDYIQHHEEHRFRFVCTVGN